MATEPTLLHCPQCDARIERTTDRCPECGSRIEPDHDENLADKSSADSFPASDPPSH